MKINQQAVNQTLSKKPQVQSREIRHLGKEHMGEERVKKNGRKRGHLKKKNKTADLMRQVCHLNTAVKP